MSLLNRFFHKKTLEIGAPVKGKIVPIAEVNDPMFAQEMIGRGVAIIPEEGKYYAPCDGHLSVLFPSGHAYALKNRDGVDVIIHIGIDTVKLNGKNFTIYAKQGQDVNKGDLIIEVDLEAVKAAGFDMITPMVISNPGIFGNLEKRDGEVAVGDAAILLTK
ncbi:MAG: PTS glucose transporter subunit IIA [Butyrivibrio sp.]|nr:PTS glucose transporter subunit IIA [Butyrivibrio sp.]